MATVFRSPITVLQFFGNNGLPLVGGTLLTTVGGVNTTTYQDAAGSIPLPNPIPLNSRGEVSNAAGQSCELWLLANTIYTFTLFDASGNQINQYANMAGTLDAASGVTLGGNNTFTGANAFTGNTSVIDANFTVIDNVDNTKKIALQAASITTGTTRVLTAQDANGSISLTSEFAYQGLFSPTGRLILPNDYISGFALTNNGTTAYDIAVGQAMDSTNTSNIIFSAITAKSQSAWAAGSTVGGKLSAAAMANNTWYYWYSIYKTVDGTADVGFDVSNSAPTLPSGYSKFRYIGARKTQAASTSWETMTQHGDQVKFSTPPALDVSTIASTSPRTLVTVNVPAVRVEWIGNVQASVVGTQTQIVLFTDPSDTDVAPGNGATPLGSIGFGQASGVTQTTIGQVRCWTNTSAQVGARPTIGGGNLFIQTVGFIDPRGKPV